MRKNLHPEYRTVVFHDTSVDQYFFIKTTLKTHQTIDWEDGNTYPYHTIDISSASHPAYTGEQRATQLEGRVQNFKRRFGSRQLKGSR